MTIEVVNYLILTFAVLYFGYFILSIFYTRRMNRVNNDIARIDLKVGDRVMGGTVIDIEEDTVLIQPDVRAYNVMEIIPAVPYKGKFPFLYW